METVLEMTLRHVAEGERHVQRQREIIAELQRDGHPVEEAEKLLAGFERTQRNHLDHLARLRSSD